MPLGACAATRVDGSPALARGQRIQDDRSGQRGKNGSARLPGTHKLQYMALRGGGTRASRALQSAPAPASVLIHGDAFNLGLVIATNIQIRVSNSARGE